MIGVPRTMPESIETQVKPVASRDAVDRQALAQVEKWMAVIRELSGERLVKLPS